jgi:hypothetical protein
MIHFESFEIWLESHASVIIIFVGRFDDWFLSLAHVITPSLSVVEFVLGVLGLNSKLSRKDVGKLGPKTISSSSDFLLVIVII